jgi:hypothetical protein
MKTRQLICLVVAFILSCVVVVEAVVGGHFETLRIFAATIGGALAFGYASRFP